MLFGTRNAEKIHQHLIDLLTSPVSWCSQSTYGNPKSHFSTILFTWPYFWDTV